MECQTNAIGFKALVIPRNKCQQHFEIGILSNIRIPGVKRRLTMSANERHKLKVLPEEFRRVYDLERIFIIEMRWKMFGEAAESAVSGRCITGNVYNFYTR